MKQTLLALLFVLGSFHLSAQSLTGTNGLFKIPSAYVAPDGHSYIGASFYPKGYYELYGNGNRFTGMPTFITLSFYDRVEFMFRYTHQLGQVVSFETGYFPDRMFTVRYRLVNEGYNYPAITIGLHDFSEAFGGTTVLPNFYASYLVSSKTFETPDLIFGTTLGYGFDLTDSYNPPLFEGFFTGVEVTFTHFPYVTLVAEYDSESFNAALKTTVLGHLHFAVGLLDMQALSGFFTYRFNLSNR
ncbi:YjbH domain-containing protein [Nonlabens sp.]|uniref:YjbH domain-containing protein n=1 Tax=Nonlabens sp. TaxID=1888209 RepID=UPI001BD10AC3|nr:YjbH domain-containing protein [Nonlabens sp.]